jgi:hypothetical protein
MRPVLGVGVPMWGDVGGGFDVWLPLYMVSTLLLIRFVARIRLSVTSSIAAFAGGTLWAWWAGSAGAIPAAALAVLLAVVLGEVVRRHPRPERPPR